MKMSIRVCQLFVTTRRGEINTKTLCIINNEFNLYALLYIFAELGISKSDIYLNKEYVNDEREYHLKELLKDNAVFSIKQSINNNYNFIFAPSNLTDGIMHLLNNVECTNQLYLFEDGTYDYTDSVAENIYTEKSIKYVFNKALIKKPACLELREIDKKRNIDLNIVFESELRQIKEIKEIKADVILFTSPLQEDFNMNIVDEVINYMDEHFEGRTVLIKKHPRDRHHYSFKKCNGVVIPISVFSQLLVNELDILQFYEFPSTTILFSKQVENIRLFRFGGNNVAYENGFRNSNLLAIEPILL